MFTHVLASVMLILAISNCAQALNGDITLHGVLVAEPCTVSPGSVTQTVKFGSVVKNMLYLHQRSNGYKFAIKLEECDLSLGNQVQISFTGTEAASQPGLLATRGTAQGIAIGLEDSMGKPVKINQQILNYPLREGQNRLDFAAYISSSTDEIEQQKIVEGDFQTTVTFLLNYP